tara:strand:- start:454 stop:882 length:429 start_codon:yes stop_codon:yes gene_type:complete
MIGAYLSTSYHRAACDVGFYKGWPLCQNSILPTLKQFGIMLNYGHRLSAVAVAGMLYYLWREIKNEIKDSSNIVRKMINLTIVFYGINILLGGLYVVTALDGVFLGWISLLHLLIGACVFLTLASTHVIANLVTSGRENVTS